MGESGSGKSTIALSILGLVPPPGRVAGGKIMFDGMNLLELKDDLLNKIRGKRIGTCFQDPASFLNPLMKVGDQIAEMFVFHEHLSKDEARRKTVETMETVGIPSAGERFSNYPHEFSGGMKQRILIAEAVCCNPELIIADEPTSDLDVLTQNEILHLLKGLTNKLDSTLLLITHDLGIVAQLCDRVIVLYGGRISEDADVQAIFHSSLHPYTIGLMKSTTRLGRGRTRLETMKGTVPSLVHPPDGCRFHPRCPFAIDECRTREPELRSITPGHRVACHLAEEMGKRT